MILYTSGAISNSFDADRPDGSDFWVREYAAVSPTRNLSQDMPSRPFLPSPSAPSARNAFDRPGRHKENSAVRIPRGEHGCALRGPGRQVTAVGGFKNDPQDTIGSDEAVDDANRSRNAGS